MARTCEVREMRRATAGLTVVRGNPEKVTGELLEIERLTSSSEGGRWKSTRKGNSLAAYPTARAVSRGGGGGNVTSLPDCQRREGTPKARRHHHTPI